MSNLLAPFLFKHCVDSQSDLELVPWYIRKFRSISREDIMLSFGLCLEPPAASFCTAKKMRWQHPFSRTTFQLVGC